MNKHKIRRRLAASRLAPVAVLPLRLRAIWQFNSQQLRLSVWWLIASREHTNYTYDISPLNRENLAWFVSSVTDRPVSEIRGYLAEIENSAGLRAHIVRATGRSTRKGLADRDAKFGRRIGWYAIVRAAKPRHVVETGTDKGLGAVVMAEALLRNGAGRLTTIDINSSAGYLVQDQYAEVVTLAHGDSIRVLNALNESVDLFLHDSDHSAHHEAAEFRAVAEHLTAHSVVLSDNAEVTTELAKWAEVTGRRFLFFDERPEHHWFPGGGIGAAWRLE
jgi:hypothetical protein